jgi:CheR methyltransferase, SAM binding domain
MRALEHRILPDLISRRRHQRRLRLWSAACSTGEEAYSLAILVAPLIPDLRNWDVVILSYRRQRPVVGARPASSVPTVVVAWHGPDSAS